jgi:hypothetical protein
VSVPSNLLSANTSSMETDITGWTAGASTTLASSTRFYQGAKSLQMTRTGTAGAASATTASRVPVTAGTEYQAYAYFALIVAAAGRTATVAVSWWSAPSGGSPISTATSAAATLANATSWNTPPPILIATAPAGATHASVTVQVAGMAINESVAVDAVALGVPNVWAENLLPYNVAGVEVDASGWTAASNATIARTSTGVYEGWYALQATAAAAGDMRIRQVTGTPVTPGTEYVAWTYVQALAAASGRPFLMELWWYDSVGTQIGSPTSQEWAPVSGSYMRVVVSGKAPAGAATAKITMRPQASAAGQQWVTDQHYLAPADMVAGNLLSFNAQSVEASVSDWAVDAGGTITQEPGTALTYWHSLKLVCAGGGPAVVSLAVPLPVTAREVYQWKVGIRNPSINAPASTRMEWLDSGGSVIRTLQTNWTSPSVSWWYFTMSDVAPEGAVSLRVAFIAREPAAGETWHMDQASVIIGGLAALPQDLGEQYAAQIELEGLNSLNMNRWGLWRVGPGGEHIPVRGMSGDLTAVTTTGPTALVVDYEAPLGTPVQYYVRAWLTPGTASISHTSEPVTLTAPEPDMIVLKDPGLPARNTVAQAKLAPNWGRKARRGVHEPRGRARPIIVSDRRGAPEGVLQVWTRDDDERRRLDWLLDPGSVLLLQFPPGAGIDSDMYVSVGDTEEQRPTEDAFDPWRAWPLPITQVDRPVGGMAGSAGRTVADVIAEAATVADLMTMYATAMGVLTGIEGT